MRIEARLRDRSGQHTVEVATNGSTRAIAIPPRDGAPGSAVNGAELLCAALATCYCNDLYREAGKLGIAVERVDVEVFAQFGSAGEAARSIRYTATVAARASEAAIRALMLHTDRVAEIHNTLRLGMPVTFDAPRADAIG
jgi:organic hydroperoxide reductase OsmC/OhrA